MPDFLLDQAKKIAKFDSRNMQGSVALLGAQISQVRQEAGRVRVPAFYRTVKNIVVCGMGGSTLGAHIIKTAGREDLRAPLEIVNDYHLPAFVNKNSLVMAVSYSGTTAEPIAALAEAGRRGAKLLVVTSGGPLAAMARRQKIPALIFSVKNNPCGQPRIGVGYTLAGPLELLKRAGLLKFSSQNFLALQQAAEHYKNNFGPRLATAKNIAKQLALRLLGRTVWYCAAEHLAGNAHVAANQLNENAKRFGGYFIIPELNHHLIEGLRFPKQLTRLSAFVLLQSREYDRRIQKRFVVTAQIFKKYDLPTLIYSCRERTRWGQVGEVLALSSHVAFYSAILESLDPSAIPDVDFLKRALNK